jgi:peptidoglycan/xylan/chitin deacetylase (PgdA/CDA1 family)
MFHDVMVERGGEDRAVNATRAEFKDYIDELLADGAHFLTLEQLHRHLTRGEAVPEKSIVLTFDDNYQGFFDNAYPILKAKSTSGKHPKMTWDTLKALDKEGLVTIGSHTLSHPADITLMTADVQETELTQSKATLEQQLGHPVPFFAYPDGKQDAVTRDLAMKAGYTMAFTMHNGPAEESPGILVVDRYNYTSLRKGWADAQAAAINAPAAVINTHITASPVELHVARFGGTLLGMVTGGTPSTWRSGETARQTVGEFIQEATAKGTPAVAGMNGTFFANANVSGNDNMMIGPSKTYADPPFFPENDPIRLAKLLDRPLVMWGPTRFVIVPFNTETMNDAASLQAFMPDLTDVFLAGAWIVHDGKARDRKTMSAYSARDFNDPRRRAFFGIDAKGQVVLGGSLEVITTEQLARAAAAAGVQEAVLMDSGFSTSIIFDNKIIVTGHTAKDKPSRPVPHAILVSGTLQQPTDPGTLAALQTADPATVAGASTASATPGPDGTIPPPDPSAIDPAIATGANPSPSPSPDLALPTHRRRRHRRRAS